MPPGYDFKLIDPADGEPVSYDACWEEKDGTMGEAKGPGYDKHLADANDWPSWYGGLQQIKDQLESQSRAAGDREVEWHFAEEGPAEYFRHYVESNRTTLPNIEVFYTPPASQR